MSEYTYTCAALADGRVHCPPIRYQMVAGRPYEPASCEVVLEPGTPILDIVISGVAG